MSWHLLPLFVLFAVFRVSGTQENHLSPAIANLLTLTRVTNGIGIQAALMRNPAKLDTIIADCLDIDDHSKISELLKVDIEALSKDINDLVPEIGRIHLLPLDWNSISSTVDLLDSIQHENIPNDGIDWSTVKTDWNGTAKQIKNIEAGKVALRKYFVDIDKAKNRSVTLMDLNITVSREGAIMERMFEGFRSFPEVIQSTASYFDFLAKISSSLQTYRGNFDRLLTSNSKDMFVALEQQVKLMDPLVAMSQKSVLVGKSVDVLKATPSASASPGAIGGVDFAKMFDDLQTNAWLRDHIGHGEGMSMLIEALDPLKDVQFSMNSLIGNWTTVKRGLGSTDIVAALVKTAKGMNVSELATMAEKSVKCFDDLKQLTNVNPFDDFEKFYKEVGTFRKQITLMNTAVDLVLNSEYFDPMLSLLRNPSIVTDNMVNIQKIANFNEIAALMHVFELTMERVNLSSIVTHMANVPNVNGTLSKLDNSQFMASLECFRNASFDRVSFEEFLELQKKLSELKTNQVSHVDMKNFVVAVQSMAKAEEDLALVAAKMKASREDDHSKASKRLLWMPVPDRIAYDLSRGVRVLQEIEQVLKHRDRLRPVVEIDNDRVDAFINGLPGIDGSWTPNNKEALMKLTEEVKVFDGKAGNLTDVWRLFSEAQELSGAPINGHVLGGRVAEAMKQSKDAKINVFSHLLHDFPPLQLDYTSEKRMDLATASSTEKAISVFFRKFFGKESPPPPFTELYASIFVSGIVTVLSLAATVFVAFCISKKHTHKDHKKAS